MLPLARFSPPCSPPLSFGNTPRLFIVGVCLNFMDHLELTRVKWSSVVPGWVPRQDILPTSREACLVTFHQRRSFLTPKALIPLGLIYISSAWLTLLFSLYRQTGNVANFNSVLRSSTSHRPMGTQPASPLRTAFPPRRSRLVVLQCGVWHHRSNPQRSYAPWRYVNVIMEVSPRSRAMHSRRCRFLPVLNSCGVMTGVVPLQSRTLFLDDLMGFLV